MSMLQRISLTAVTALLLGTVDVSAGELPQYEVAGFPISPHQISVLEPGGIQEQTIIPDVHARSDANLSAVVGPELRSPKTEQRRASSTSAADD